MINKYFNKIFIDRLKSLKGLNYPLLDPEQPLYVNEDRDNKIHFYYDSVPFNNE